MVRVGVQVGVMVGVFVLVLVLVDVRLGVLVVVEVPVKLAVEIEVEVEVLVGVVVAVCVGVRVGVGLTGGHTFAIPALGVARIYVAVLRAPPEPSGHRPIETTVPVPPAFSSTWGCPGFRSVSSSGSSGSLVSYTTASNKLVVVMGVPLGNWPASPK